MRMEKPGPRTFQACALGSASTRVKGGTANHTSGLTNGDHPSRRPAAWASSDRNSTASATARARDIAALLRRLRQLLLAPAQHGLARGGGLVEAAARAKARGALEARRLAGLCLQRQFAQDMDEAVERFLRLRFGRLDQH